MVPYSFTYTSHIIVTFALAAVVFVGVTVIGFVRHGMKFLKLFVPEGVPVFLLPLLVVIEILFRYQGIGSLIFTAANKKDFPMLQAGVMVVGALFMVATFIADILQAALNPRIRLGGQS